MYKVKVTVIALLGLLFVQTSSAEDITASQLLTKLADNRDKLQSFILRVEVDREVSFAMVRQPIKKHVSLEVAFDGARVKACSKKNTIVSEDPRGLDQYIYYHWDGSTYTTYEKGPSSAGQVFIDKNYKVGEKYLYYTVSQSLALWGYFNEDPAWIDAVLLEAESISVRPEREEINGSPCFVIDAETIGGEYTLWIDPQHGYNIARAECLRSIGDLAGGRPLKEGAHSFFTLSNVRFEKIDDIWIPMEADVEMKATYTKEHGYNLKEHIERTYMVLNPDHEKLDSFSMYKIENGAEVYITGHGVVKYSWQQGDLIPLYEKEVIASIEKEVAQIQGQQIPLVNAEALDVVIEEDSREELDPNYIAESVGCRPPGVRFDGPIENPGAGTESSLLSAVIPAGALAPIIFFSAIRFLYLYRKARRDAAL